MKSLEEIERIIGYEFKDKNLLELALVHSSFGKPNNERLEFLGDAVLDMLVADLLYTDLSDAEGSLTKKRAVLVCESNLSRIVKENKLCDFIKFGSSFKSEPSNAVCADLFESIIGAIYLDSGKTLNNAKNFILKFINVDDCNAVDYKTELQEIVQQEKNATIEYRTKDVSKSLNLPKFQSEVVINGKSCAIGYGGSKKEAERNAAQKVYEDKMR